MRIRITLISLIAALCGTAYGIHPVYESGPVEFHLGQNPSVSEQIDDLIFKRLHELDLDPANLTSDSAFLRRAYLVVIGTLPSAEEVTRFLGSADPNRRTQLIDELLARDEFPEYWAMKWCDVLRVKAEFPIKLWPNAVQAYYRWIFTSLRANKPYDQFVRELLLANGSNFRNGEVNFFRAMQDRSPDGIAATVALTLMGERADKWPKKKLEALGGFFCELSYKSTAEWKEEIVYYDPIADKENRAETAIFPDGTPGNLRKFKQDPREVFADWLIRPENPAFSRAIVNRIWAWLMGRGIVEEPDDIRPDNPPSNPALLELLQKDFIANNYDLKHVYRVILNTKTFQLSSIPNLDAPEATANFAHYPLRRMEAEVMIDALNLITVTDEVYSSPIPEPFTFVPEDIRAIGIADGSITSSFLELFGRPPRDTGYMAERNTRSSSQQRLHLLNSSHVLKKIKTCPLVTKAVEEKWDTEKLARTAYLTILSRNPMPEEIQAITQYGGSDGGKDLAEDLVWMLLNQPEFNYIH